MVRKIISIDEFIAMTPEDLENEEINELNGGLSFDIDFKGMKVSDIVERYGGETIDEIIESLEKLKTKKKS